MCDADDPPHAELRESVVDEGPRAFGREPLAPGIEKQPIADLDVGRRRAILQTIPADECPVVAPRCAPHAQSWIKRVIAGHALHGGPDFGAPHRLAAIDVPEHTRIAVEAQQVVEIRGRELSHRQSRCAQQNACSGTRHRSYALSPSSANSSAWYSCASACVSSNRSPSMMASILYSVRLMR